MNMQTANVLNNGAHILARQQSGPDRWFVICAWPGHVDPYVTWQCDSQGNAYWGHYFKTYDEAHRDYYKRIYAAVVPQ